MKRAWLRVVCLTACMMVCAFGALAQNVIQVYVSESAADPESARQLTELLDRAFPQAEFTLMEEAESLRTLVLADDAPQIAICSPGEALVWTKEGLTLPLQQHISDQEEIAREVLGVCVYEENLFMAPLIARHRQMAVNVKMIEKKALGYMLDEIAHPVWYPTEFQQILEEFTLENEQAMDVWKLEAQEGAAIEAFLQALYCGSLLGEDGTTCEADSKAMQASVRWLRMMVGNGMIGYQQTRQEALDRFAAGETAIFLDWTKQLQTEYAQQLRDAGIEIETRPYPSSSGLPVRSYELTGVTVFDSGDAQSNALALQAAAFLHESAGVETILGARGIFEDDSIWLWDLSANERGATVRSLLHRVMEELIGTQQDVTQALERIKAEMDTAR